MGDRELMSLPAVSPRRRWGRSGGRDADQATDTPGPPGTPVPGRVRRVARAIFAGDRRVWLWGGLPTLALFAVVVAWCLVPRAYFTGTDSVNEDAPTPAWAAGHPVCQAGLTIPAGTRRFQVAAEAGTGLRRIDLALDVAGQPTIHAVTTPKPAPYGQGVVFDLGAGVVRTAPATACLTATGGSFALLGDADSSLLPPLTAPGPATQWRISAWYLPASGARRSFLAELGTMLGRASLFAPGYVSPVLLGIVLLGLVPLLALVALRCLALAAVGRARRLALWIYVIAALNAMAWSVITPPFQAPDEVDHFAYVQSIVERGARPDPVPRPTNARWSGQEFAALVGSAFFTDHQGVDIRLPGLSADRTAYHRLVTATHPRAADGGGPETTVSYGPLYYLSVAPGYLLAPSGSVFTQLGLTRLLSALLGALAAAFAVLAVRELAPRHLWAAALAGLIVAFEPMYGFLSGALNNDVGVNAGAAAVAYLLIRLLRRGPRAGALIALGLLLGALPYAKDSAYELDPIAALALLAVVWRARTTIRRRPGAAVGLLGVLAVAAIGGDLIGSGINGALAPPPPPPATGAPVVTTAGGALSAPLHAPLSYLSYLWEVFLPRLPGMAPHFPPLGLPAQTIYTKRGWAAFGWYDVLFPHWVYQVIAALMLGAILLGLIAIVRERPALRGRRLELGLLVGFPVAVVAAVEAVFYTAGSRPTFAEMGRYAFPALVPLAVLAAGALAGLGRRRVVPAAALLLAVLLGFSLASQALEFTAFFS